MRIDDEILVAYADGELTGLRRAEVEQALAEDPGLRARLALHQHVRRRVASHYAPVAAEPVPERLTAMLSDAAPGTEAPEDDKIVDLAAARERRRTRPMWQGFAALAATFVLALGLGQVLPFADFAGEGDAVAVADGMLIARGGLAAALDERLAADRARPGETRIGVSFAAADGRFCRTFDGAAMSGLACRGDAGWQLVATASASAATGQYRQASSGSALVLAAAQEMMAGEPLDAAGERRARDAGWRNRRAPD